jgi:hypothetical protein
MSDEQQEQEGKRKKRPAIGGISQYATIGSKRSTAEHQDAQVLEHSDIQTSGRADVQDIRSSDVLTTKRQDIQTPERIDIQDTRRSDVPAPKHQDIQTPEHVDVQDTRRSDVPASKHQDIQASDIPDAQRKLKPDRNRQTVYLEPDLDDWIRERIIRERKRLGHRVEISDIVNEAVRLYKNSINNP